MEEFIKKHGRDIALAVVALYALSTGSKVNRLEIRTKRAFKNVDKNLANLFDFKEKCWDNFDILKTDMNQIATFSGFKGSLGVNT